jgi:hypothetical protein
MMAAMPLEKIGRMISGVECSGRRRQLSWPVNDNYLGR